MTSESREQILASFMECTALEDYSESIQILDQYQWNLLNAVHAVQERLGGADASNHHSTAPKPSATRSAAPRSTVNKHASLVKKTTPTKQNAKRHSDSEENDGADEPRIIKTLPSAPRASKPTSAAASRGPARDLHFTVECKDRTERLTVPDSENVHYLRVKIAEKINVSPNRQNFTNWSTKSYDDRTILKDLNLPRENQIHVIATASTITNGATRASPSTSSSSSSTANRSHRTHVPLSKTVSTISANEFPLTVRFEERPSRFTPYELVLQSTATIGEMKRQMEQMTRVPVRQQQWSGLAGAGDSEELGRTSLRRKATLSFRKTDTSSSSSSQPSTSVRREVKPPPLVKHQSEDELMEIDPVLDVEGQFDDDITEIGYATRHTTTASSGSSNRELLIPERCTDEILGLENFTRVFHLRYNSTGPILYIGPLEQAIHDSLFTSIHERRPLAIYLHHDRAICANVFCSQVLATDTIIEYFANNYVVWAWDFTSDTNRTRFLETFKRCVNAQFAQRIAVMEKDAFPLLIILTRTRGTLEIINFIEGKSTPAEVLSNLIQSHDAFNQQRQRDLEEETMRETRANLKKQQEDEYNQSLQTDLAKEQARQADEQRQKEEQYSNERLKQKRMKEQRECQARLPKEPSETEKNTTRLKIRLPDNEGILMRRFLINETLQTLFDYLSSQGRMFGEYKLLSTFPKRDLTSLNKSDTFEQLKLYPQEQLILESL